MLRAESEEWGLYIEFLEFLKSLKDGSKEE
ncbi:hypothetical protein X928_07690 [Petrotoga miotherma DSM 10691]|uniref:Uncharacterized protein n=1 Tax=Petrotoga miotherma DSM 10691 TaxID=1434326 RepID=A0A2K1P933_9BACT|nr:hypothetical protein X928_07690 [Petrotoga miotherma DSM 10691]